METAPCHRVTRFELDLDFEAMLYEAELAGWAPGHLLAGDSIVAPAEIRRCHASNGIAPRTLADIVALVSGVAEEEYGFAVDGTRDYDPALVIRYQVGDHFDWHVDNGVDGPPGGSRKLSFTLQLSRGEDYAGGDLELATYTQAYFGDPEPMREGLRRRGSLIVFPAFMLHRVTPLVRGTRYALVGWVHGPAFR